MMAAMRTVVSTFGMAMLVVVGTAWRPPAASQQDWPVYAADDAATHFSPLTDLDKSTIGRAQILWEWKTGDDSVQAPPLSLARRRGA
jgi:glucose dehydrogenase